MLSDRHTKEPMKKTTYTLLAFGALAFTAASIFSSCATGNPDSPGVEYMPDMYRSPSVETNGIEYLPDSMFLNGKWVYDSVHMGNRLPPEGTIPRGFTPFPYANDTTGDKLASAFWKSPYATSDSIEAQGKFLYERFCIYCHGDKGDGQGKLVTSGKYPATPPKYSDKLEAGILTDGHIYWVITYGKGNMGSHAGQVSPDERWKIIQYVQHLARGGKSLADYNADKIKAAAAADSLKKVKPLKPAGVTIR
jgi:mono/diheme cytochrome c family protein